MWNYNLNLLWVCLELFIQPPLVENKKVEIFIQYVRAIILPREEIKKNYMVGIVNTQKNLNAKNFNVEKRFLFSRETTYFYSLPPKKTNKQTNKVEE